MATCFGSAVSPSYSFSSPALATHAPVGYELDGHDRVAKNGDIFIKRIQDRAFCLRDRRDQQEGLPAAELVFDSEPVVSKGVRRRIGGVPFVEGRAVFASAGGTPVTDDDPPCGREHTPDLRERVVACEL